MTTALAPAGPLTAADRCDRCGAQAYVRVRLADQFGGGQLLFCGHHAREHLARLREVAADIQDESGRLTGPAAAEPSSQER